MPQKSFLPPNTWETLSESTKQMIIEHNKKVKLNNPTPYPSGSKTKPNPTLGKPTPAPQQAHQHSQDEPTEKPTPDTSNQTLVNKCLDEGGIDTQTSKMLCQCLMPKGTFHPMDLQDKYKPIKNMYLQGTINPNTTIVMTWIPLTPQAQYQPLSKLPVMTHTTPSVLIA